MHIGCTFNHTAKRGRFKGSSILFAMGDIETLEEVVGFYDKGGN